VTETGSRNSPVSIRNYLYAEKEPNIQHQLRKEEQEAAQSARALLVMVITVNNLKTVLTVSTT
jgi:hypothetical protein